MLPVISEHSVTGCSWGEVRLGGKLDGAKRLKMDGIGARGLQCRQAWAIGSICG
jgi:hypothetical protein